MTARFNDPTTRLQSVLVQFNHLEYECPSPTLSIPTSFISSALPKRRNPASTKQLAIERTPPADKFQSANLSHSTAPRVVLGHLTTPTMPSVEPCHTLPSQASSESLQLPALLEFSFKTSSPSLDLTLKPPLEVDTSARLPPLSPTSEPTTPLDQFSSPFNPSLDAIAFSHPNSPYVPWTSPVRREFLRPLTPASFISGITSAYSRPYSRSGARAPEPTDSSDDHLPIPDIKKAKLSQSFRNFRRIIKLNVKGVARRFSMLAKPFHACGARTAPVPIITSRRRISYSTSALPSPAPSGDSSNSTTLVAWLAQRQREVELFHDPSNGISIDEYERMGSWVNISPSGDEVCDPPDDFSLITGKEVIRLTPHAHSILSVLHDGDSPVQFLASQSSPQLSRISAWHDNAQAVGPHDMCPTSPSATMRGCGMHGGCS
ncbi:hypothetical protein BDN72DRAFT_953421 [Pluteus cervinus]|uniref:Uncharacterized protein n=1 Tax=Pluteus cervinus TaxID=181527 RepID=A0ACD3BGB9_9AGAR|nr:hypothetical protein BDN72DRAFT_953421 [Pluteus cervinus]